MSDAPVDSGHRNLCDLRARPKSDTGWYDLIRITDHRHIVHDTAQLGAIVRNDSIRGSKQKLTLNLKFPH